MFFYRPPTRHKVITFGNIRPYLSHNPNKRHCFEWKTWTLFSNACFEWGGGGGGGGLHIFPDVSLLVLTKDYGWHTLC